MHFRGAEDESNDRCSASSPFAEWPEVTQEEGSWQLLRGLCGPTHKSKSMLPWLTTDCFAIEKLGKVQVANTIRHITIDL